jgi:hypothetical protein
MQEERRWRTWEAPDVPASGKRQRMVYSSLGTQGETRTRSDAGTVPLMRNVRQGGGGVLSQGKTGARPWGVVSRRVLSGGESPRQGEGRDGSPEPAQDTSAGPCRIGPPEAHRPAGHRPHSENRQAAPLSGSVRVPGCRPVTRRLGGPESAGRQWGRWPDGPSRRRQRTGQHHGIGAAPERKTLPGHTGPALLHTAGKRRRKAVRDSRTRRHTGASGLREAVDGHR